MPATFSAKLFAPATFDPWLLNGMEVGDPPAPPGRPTTVTDDGIGTEWAGKDDLADGTGPATADIEFGDTAAQVLTMSNWVNSDGDGLQPPLGQFVRGITIRLKAWRSSGTPTLTGLTLTFPDASDEVLDAVLPLTGTSTWYEYGGPNERFGKTTADLGIWIDSLVLSVAGSGVFEDGLVIDNVEIVPTFSNFDPDNPGVDRYRLNWYGYSSLKVTPFGPPRP